LIAFVTLSLAPQPIVVTVASPDRHDLRADLVRRAAERGRLAHRQVHPERDQVLAAVEKIVVAAELGPALDRLARREPVEVG
jgi:hypothetical protein